MTCFRLDVDDIVLSESDTEAIERLKIYDKLGRHFPRRYSGIGKIQQKESNLCQTKIAMK